MNFSTSGNIVNRGSGAEPPNARPDDDDDDEEEEEEEELELAGPGSCDLQWKGGSRFVSATGAADAAPFEFPFAALVGMRDRGFRLSVDLRDGRTRFDGWDRERSKTAEEVIYQCGGTLINRR